MLSLSHNDSSLVRTPEQIAQDFGPDFTVVDGIVTPQKQLLPDGTRKPKYDYRVPHAAKCETTFRHSHWKAKREKVLAALTSAGESTFALDRFAQCGSGCVVERSPSLKKLRLKASYCKSRHCEPCMRAKANKMAANLRNRLAEKPDGRYRFITLTLRHNTKPLAEQIQRLYASFKKLRKTRCWQDTQRGGAATLEVKWKPATRHWHPHLHIIAEGDFLHKRDLTEAWLKVTGDSCIIDIRALNNAKDAAHYVAKYVTKGTNSEVWLDTDAAQEWILAMKGVRACATYGTWRGYRLLAVTDQAKDWTPVVSLIQLYDDIERGEPYAMAILKQLNAKRVAAERHVDPPPPSLFS